MKVRARGKPEPGGAERERRPRVWERATCVTSQRPGQSSSAQRARAVLGGPGADAEFLLQACAEHLCAERGPERSRYARAPWVLESSPGGGRCRQGALWGEPARCTAVRSRGRGCKGHKRGTAPVSTARHVRHPCVLALSLHPLCPFLSLAYCPGWPPADWDWPSLRRVSCSFGALGETFFLFCWERCGRREREERDQRGEAGLKPLCLPVPILHQAFGKAKLNPNAGCTSLSVTLNP